MFMQKGNTFLPQGDGGFINYSFNTDGTCKHTDGKFICSSFQLSLMILLRFRGSPFLPKVWLDLSILGYIANNALLHCAYLTPPE